MAKNGNDDGDGKDPNKPQYEKRGYGKPPKKSQFKPGQSGNPKGRPKGSKSLKSIVERELGKKMTIIIDGEPLKVSRLEAMFLAQWQKATAKQNTSAFREIMKLINQLKLFAEKDERHVWPGGIIAVPGMARSIEEWENEPNKSPVYKPGIEESDTKGEDED